MLIDQFFERGQNFLGCRYPIMCGAMTWISDYKLVGDVEGGSLMAGQSVGLADKIMPIEDIMSELVNDAETELQRLKKMLR